MALYWDCTRIAQGWAFDNSARSLIECNHRMSHPHDARGPSGRPSPRCAQADAGPKPTASAPIGPLVPRPGRGRAHAHRPRPGHRANAKHSGLITPQLRTSGARGGPVPWAPPSAPSAGTYRAARPRPLPAPGPPAQSGHRLLYASAPPAPPGRGLFRLRCRPMQPAGQARQAGSAIQVDFPHAAGVCYSAIRGRPQATCLWSPVINKIQQGNEP